MSWIYLFIAGIFEVSWAVGLKYSEGFTRLVPSVLTIAGSAASFWSLSLALRHLPLGTAYAVWTGIGIVGTFIFDVYAFHEPVSFAKTVSVALIALGIAGLRLL